VLNGFTIEEWSVLAIMVGDPKYLEEDPTVTMGGVLKGRYLNLSIP
jgi:hypothetical protein